MSEREPHYDLSIVVASYNVAPLLRQCLDSLRDASDGMAVQVVVIDNRSSDGSPEMVERLFPEARLIRNDRNEGFSRANNRALQEAAGRYLLLLNPDTRIPPQTLRPMVEFLEEKTDVGVVGCRLERPDGGMDEACKRSFPTPMNALARFLHLDRLFPRSRTLGAYRRTWQDPSGRYEVDSVVGAFMMFRRRVLEELGGLDEDFFMFGEDLDWCYRVRDRNWKVYYLGDHRVLHHKGGSTSREPHRMNYHFHRSMVLFHRKHLVNRYPFFVNWLVYTGIGLRYALKGATMLLVRPRPAPASASAGASALSGDASSSGPAGAAKEASAEHEG